MNEPWNRCDVCGKFIAMDDFDNGAVRHMLNPDAYGCEETWETLCVKHGLEDRCRVDHGNEGSMTAQPENPTSNLS